MNPYLSPSGIRLNDCFFSDPVSFTGWTPPHYAGLFAVFVHDTDWAPKPFRPLCFGEFGNNAPLAALMKHYGEWRAAGSGRNLLISVCPIPYSTSAQRMALRNELISAYNPVCQGGSAFERHDDHNAQLIASLSESQPGDRQRQPRRRIGFMPECEPAR